MEMAGHSCLVFDLIDVGTLNDRWAESTACTISFAFHTYGCEKSTANHVVFNLKIGIKRVPLQPTTLQAVRTPLS